MGPPFRRGTPPDNPAYLWEVGWKLGRGALAENIAKSVSKLGFGILSTPGAKRLPEELDVRIDCWCGGAIDRDAPFALLGSDGEL